MTYRYTYTSNYWRLCNKSMHPVVLKQGSIILSKHESSEISRIRLHVVTQSSKDELNQKGIPLTSSICLEWCKSEVRVENPVDDGRSLTSHRLFLAFRLTSMKACNYESKGHRTMQKENEWLADKKKLKEKSLRR